MDFNDYQEIIGFAIEKERETAEFYETASREATMQGVKDMLMEFAAEERKHEKLLQEVDCTSECKLTTVEYQYKWIKDIKRSDLMTEIDFQPGMAYRDILAVAMKREEKALKLYNELLAQAQTDMAKNVFKLLCQEEAKHKLKLETMYDDFMKEMGD
ncbi:MAG: ferritin family protein [Desulfatirhabdiaceae bacterium]